MIARLVLGLVKGVLLGGVLGYALAAAGMATPGAMLAYASAAVVAALTAAIAGKKVWEPDARIQVALKAIAGLLLGPALMWAARAFLTVPLPFDPASLPGVELLPGAEPTLGTFSVTSLALVAALVAGFFDADHDPAESKKQPPPPTTGRSARVDPELAELTGLSAAEIEAIEAEERERKARR